MITLWMMCFVFMLWTTRHRLHFRDGGCHAPFRENSLLSIGSPRSRRTSVTVAATDWRAAR